MKTSHRSLFVAVISLLLPHMTQRTCAIAVLIALLLNLIGGTATADPIGVDPVPVIVTADATVPSTTVSTGATVPTTTITSTTTTTVNTTSPTITATTGTTVPSTTVQVPLPTPTPIVQITTMQPVTVGTTTFVAPTTSTPLGGSIVVSGPGTTGSVPITTNVAPAGTIVLQPLPAFVIVVPSTVPTVTATAAAPIDTTGTVAGFAGSAATGTGAVRTGGTGASVAVTEPANGIAVNASAFAAVCLLADAIGRTTLDPAATVYLSTLCTGSASTAGGTAGMTAGQLAATSVDFAASLCLVASALALPSPLTTEYLASAGLDTRCGTGPSTASVDSAATALNNVTVHPSGAVAVCLIAAALTGLPTTADLSTACGDAAGGGSGLTPSVVTAGLTGTTPVVDLTGELAAALCVVAHAVADVPTTAALTTACGNTPSRIDGNAGGSTPIIDAGTTPKALTCIALNSTLPGLTSIGQTCGTGTGPAAAIPPAGAPVLGNEFTPGPGAGPDLAIGRTGQVSDPGGALRGGSSAPAGQDGTGGLLGIASLPATATAALGAGGLGLALLGLGFAALRRRKATR